MVWLPPVAVFSPFIIVYFNFHSVSELFCCIYSPVKLVDHQSLLSCSSWQGKWLHWLQSSRSHACKSPSSITFSLLMTLNLGGHMSGCLGTKNGSNNQNCFSTQTMWYYKNSVIFKVLYFSDQLTQGNLRLAASEISESKRY